MKHFYMIVNEDKDPGCLFARTLQGFIAERGGTCTLMTEGDVPEETEGLLVLGGDGTLLHAAVDHADRHIPLLGINLGTLGYLTSMEKDDARSGIDALMRGDFKVEERMMLRGNVYKQGKMVHSALALNDIVVSRAGFSKMVETRLFINDSVIDTYAGDGMIIASPTGSTGYNLSAGGPIVQPAAKLMIVTPICPHTLTARCIVVADTDVLRLEVGRRRISSPEEAAVNYDGGPEVALESGDTLIVQRASVSAPFIRVTDRSFYEVLRSKIGVR